MSSSSTIRLLPADGSGTVDGDGPAQTIFVAPPRDTLPAAATACLTGVFVVDPETVWVTDSCTGMLLELWRHPAS